MRIWCDVQNGGISLKHPIYGVDMYLWEEKPKGAKYVISFYHKRYHPLVLSDINALVPDENPMARLTFLVIKEMIKMGYCPLPTRSYRKKSQRKWTYAKPGIYNGNIILFDMVKAYKNIILKEKICFSTYGPIKFLCPPILPHIIQTYEKEYPSLYKEVFGMLACEGWLFYNPSASDHLLATCSNIMNRALSLLPSAFYGNVDSLMLISEHPEEDLERINTCQAGYTFVIKERYKSIQVVGIRKYISLDPIQENNV